MDIDTIEETQMNTEVTSTVLKTNGISNDDENRLKFYVQRIKLAVAMAVIRSTPPDMTPKNYASYLIQNYKENNNEWKKRYEILERELIILEEKLETVSLRDKFNIPDTDMGFLMENKQLGALSQQCMPPSPDLNMKINSTVQFVRSFIFLGSVKQNVIEKHLAGDHEKFGGKVLRSISILFEYLRSDEGLCLEFEITKRAMEEIHRLFDSKANFFEKDLIEISLRFVENLLLDIYKTMDINMVEYQHRRSALIQMLAEQKKLTALIVSRLLREITVLSDRFATALHSPVDDIKPLLQMENAYYVLQTTEGSLHIMRQHKSVLNCLKIPKSLMVEWDKTTEKSLTDIGSVFPMYCIYVWNIKTLLKSIFDLDVED